MEFNILNAISNHFEGKTHFTSDELKIFLYTLYPGVSDKTISWRIYDLKSKGIINHLGRNLYALNSKSYFQPNISPYLKRIYIKVKRELPLVNFCVWDSRWLNEFMLHQIFKFYLVIETDKDSTEAVFNCLTDISKKVYLNPDKEIFERYISGFNEVIIVKAIITEAPLTKIQNIQIAPLEKLLVDCISDTDLFSAQQNEISFIYSNALEKYNINLSKIRRYARRRDRLKEVEKYTSIFLNKL